MGYQFELLLAFFSVRFPLLTRTKGFFVRSTAHCRLSEQHSSSGDNPVVTVFERYTIWGCAIFMCY
jgi:hypothetical protein